MTAAADLHPFRSSGAREAYLAHYDAEAANWPVPAESLVVETADGLTQVRISGLAGAAPLVLLPGVNASSLMWAANVAGLSPACRRPSGSMRSTASTMSAAASRADRCAAPRIW